VAAAKPEMVETLEVETASAVIGRGGETIRKLQEESGARLDIEKTTEIDPETEKPKKGDVITVSGSKTAVPKALKMIDALLNPVYEAEEEIDAGDKAPRVVGPKGATITGVREDTGAYVELARGSSIVSIKGTTEAVAKAKAMIELILDPPFEAMEIDVRDGAGAIIGPNGDTIRKIQDESGARVDIKRNKNGNDTMNISGLPEAIEKAKVMLQQVLDDARPEAEQTVLCDSAAAVIGAKGVTIRAIQDESGASINIGRDEEKKKDTIHVSGLTVNVADAIDMIDAILNPRYEHQEDMLFDLKDAGAYSNPSHPFEAHGMAFTVQLTPRSAVRAHRRSEGSDHPRTPGADGRRH
jgi:polyribonucleotide nucleotidyltransferase